MDKTTFIATARKVVGGNWSNELEFIVSRGFETGLILKAKQFTKLVTDGEPSSELDDALKKVIDKYLEAKANPVAAKVGKPLGTVPDPAVTIALAARMPELTPDELKEISDHHRLSMAAENIMGYLLEEYLALYLTPLGFIYCPGEILRSIDFVTSSGRLLQVKNSDNSENSSSTKVRDSTTIEKWFRRRSTPLGLRSRAKAFKWEDLATKFGVPVAAWQDEDQFQAFVSEAITSNSALLHAPGDAIPVEPKKTRARKAVAASSEQLRLL